MYAGTQQHRKLTRVIRGGRNCLAVCAVCEGEDGAESPAQQCGIVTVPAEQRGLYEVTPAVQQSAPLCFQHFCGIVDLPPASVLVSPQDGLWTGLNPTMP